MRQSALFDAVASNPVSGTIAVTPRRPSTLRTALQQVPSGGGSGNAPEELLCRDVLTTPHQITLQ